MCVSSNIALPILYGAAGAGLAGVTGGSSLAIAAAGLSGAGAGLQSSAAIQSAKYNESAAKTQQKELNAQAQSVRASASYEAEKKLEQTKQARSKAAVQYAAAGFNPNVGTASDIQQDIVGSGAQDISVIQNNAARQAWGLEEKGRDVVSAAKQKVKSAYLNAGTSFLTSAGSGALLGAK